MRDKTVKRSFLLGDEWIYYKFYTGAKTADKVLLDAIKPITECLLSKKQIDRWFFIRYADPDLHLRFRLHITEREHLVDIIQTVNSHTKKFVDFELIWKIQTDTYQREMERYGMYTMEFSEQLFFFDSELLLDVLPQFKNSDGEVLRWLFALKVIDVLLDSFQYTIESKLQLLQLTKESFGKEFGMDHFLKSQLDTKFRKERGIIEQALNTSTEETSIIANSLIHLKIFNKKVIPVANEILLNKKSALFDIPLDSLMVSYIHMSMNRIFRSKQRLHEMVLYDFLYRYYKSMVARKKAVNDNSLVIVSK